MDKLNLNTAASARILQGTFAKIPALNKQEAERINIALKNSGVEDAVTRLNAGFALILLEQVAQ